MSRVLHQIRVTPHVRSRQDLRVVLYHGIGDNTAPCFSSLQDELPERLLNEQVAWLRRQYTLRALEDGVAPEQSTCCVTFDDGLASAYDWLRSSGVPAAVFLNTAVLDGTKLLWQHRVSYLVARFGLRSVCEALRVEALTGFALIDHCQRHFAAVQPALAAVSSAFGVIDEAITRQEQPYLSRTQIADLRRAGIRFYSHTAHHLPLAHVPAAIMRAEIDAAKADLQAQDGSDRYLSFPFGMRSDYGDEACAYALQRGYRAAFEVGDGWNPLHRQARRVIGRVGLGAQQNTPANLYAALELQPLLKGVLHALIRH